MISMWTHNCIEWSGNRRRMFLMMHKTPSTKFAVPALFCAVAMVTGIAVMEARQATGASKSLLSLDGITWRGTYAFPDIGTALPGGPGTTNYASGALAVRYVGGQRRFLMPTFTDVDRSTGQTFGDLVEWQTPATAPPYTGADTPRAAQMIETRRWRNWTLLASTPAWQEPAAGVRVGGLLWDEANGVLWYQLYSYYSGRNEPLLGATRLLDTPTSGSYRTVGQRFGPWWYRSNNPSSATEPFWKAVCNWIVRVPESSQAELRGNKVILGGTVGSVGGNGNLGPGFRAIPDLPALTDLPNSIIPMGRRLADYTSESPIVPSAAHRRANYQSDGIPYSAESSGLFPPNGSTGYWQMSLDQVNSFIWVDTPTREAIILFGRQSVGLNWYGYNPRSATPGWNPLAADAMDPTRPVEHANGYGSTAWSPALYVFDPAQVREVGRGARSPWSDGINPVAVYDWHAKWPNLPINKYRPDPSVLHSQPIESNISNSGFWDPVTQEILWVQPSSVAVDKPQATLNIFTIVAPPRPPSNLRVIR